MIERVLDFLGGIKRTAFSLVESFIRMQLSTKMGCEQAPLSGKE